ncbi:MAG: carboxylesterase family protein, partial [Abditibacteriota bacterium]|nr:carboxylesterase family protein [Abditibacteriota bacterium]
DSSAMDIYDLRPLAKAFGDVVFVSVEYRLGLLGFGDFRNVEGGGCCSPGLLDIACALEWIRDNIEDFGGDPGRVTLFGQSAGAGCISLLPLLPQARGLFRRMILQSGSPSLVTTPEAAQKTAAAFMDKTGCRSLKDLQRLPGEAFAAFAACAPVTESPLLPRSLTEIYQKAASPLYGGIDILAGTNRDEMDYFTLLLGRDRAEEAQAAAHRRRLALLPEGAKEKAQKLFSPENGLSPYEACCRFAGAALFHAPCLALCRARRAFRTYAYSFEVPSGKPGIGACHAAELSYVFGNFRYGYAGKNAAPGVSGLMQQLWTSFAETGVPEAENLLWPPFGNSGCALVFAPEGAYARENAFGKYEALEELAYIPVHAAGLF